jgi:hypothetical protein
VCRFQGLWRCQHSTYGKVAAFLHVLFSAPPECEHLDAGQHRGCLRRASWRFQELLGDGYPGFRDFEGKCPTQKRLLLHRTSPKVVWSGRDIVLGFALSVFLANPTAVSIPLLLDEAMSAFAATGRLPPEAEWVCPRALLAAEQGWDVQAAVPLIRKGLSDFAPHAQFCAVDEPSWR